MLTLIDVLSSDQQLALRDCLNQHSSLLQPDVSQYAVGRQRFWLEHQPVLGSYGKQYEPAVKLPWIWKLCRQIYQRSLEQVNLPSSSEAAFGLAAYGQIGIKSHRDDTYAACPAVSINLSTQPTLWGYVPSYSGYEHRLPKPADEVVHTLPPGAIILFNSKNLHRVVKGDAKRWSLNLWSLAPKCRPYFENYLKEEQALESSRV